jgi:tRNA G37 N-methylase TrmD
MTLDLTITLGNIIEIGVICAGGISALAVMRASVRHLKDELSDMKKDSSDQFAEMKQDSKERFEGIEFEIKKIGEVLINQADQNRRIIHLEEDVRELRHGRGFVRGPDGIDREYQ